MRSMSRCVVDRGVRTARGAPRGESVGCLCVCPGVEHLGWAAARNHPIHLRALWAGAGEK
eukprot:2544916-Rhodomonas_salina.1